MATTTKSAKTAKPASAKKPAAKKTAAVKKPAAKAAPAKKSTAVKPAAKKPAVKAAPAKKPAAKAAPAKKSAAVKPAAKAAVKNPAHAAEPDAPDSGIKAIDLFEAYAKGKLPKDHGYIVSSFFSENSLYGIYEVVSYSGVKAIHVTETGLLFQTNGKKLYVLLEPASYATKYMEPVSRKEEERIPKRFSELEIIIAKNQTKIMIAKEPVESFASFTVLKPSGINFAIVFYNLADVYDTIGIFFEHSFNKELKVPQADAKKAAVVVSRMVENTMSFKGEFA